MVGSSNYIKIKSRRLLRRQIKASKQNINTAGSNDLDNTPGSTRGSTSTPTETTTMMSGQYSSNEVFFGESLSLQSGGMGMGSVSVPPEKPRDSSTSENMGAYYKTSTSIRDLNRPRNADLPGSYIEPGSVESNPLEGGQAGSVTQETERTTSVDGDRIKRTRARDRRRARRRFY